MIDAFEFAGLLNRRHILRLLDHAEDAVIAIGIAAEDAWIDVGDVMASRAVRDAFFHVADGVSQPLGRVAGGLENMKSQALGSLGADTWQALQFFYETNEGWGKGHRN